MDIALGGGKYDVEWAQGYSVYTMKKLKLW